MSTVASHRAETETWPVTHQQYFLWKYFHMGEGNHRLDTFVLRVTGQLDADILHRCLDEIVRRHEALRSRIVTVDGTPLQYFDEPRRFELKLVSLADVQIAERESLACRSIEEFSARRCDMSRGPLFDVQLLRLSERDHLLVWGIHHIISDAVTIAILFHELWSLYGAHQRAAPSPLRAAPSYAAYAQWQHATSQEWLDRHGAYWQSRISRATRLQWPSIGGSLTPSSGLVRAAVDIPAASRADLRRLAQQTRTTPAMVLTAVYAAVASAWCSQSFFTIPVNISGRHRAEHEYLVGYFAQMLYLEIELNAGETFLELLSKTAREFRQALSHQDFGRVALQAPQAIAGSVFSWMPSRFEDMGVPSPEVAAGIGLQVAQFPFKQRPNGALNCRGIGVTFFENRADFTGGAWCEPGVYPQETVDRFAADLRRTVMQVAVSPASAVIR